MPVGLTKDERESDAMSVIVDFPLHRVSETSALPAGQRADVIIFPGVRIERQENAGAVASAPAKMRCAAPAAAPERDLG